MPDENNNFRVTTWEKSLILRKRRNWEIIDLVDFLNRKGVTKKPLLAAHYKAWETGKVKAPKEITERIDDLLTLELYRTQPT